MTVISSDKTKSAMPPLTDARRREVRNFLEKVVINAGIGRLSQQQNFKDKILPQIKADLALLAGQMPHETKLRKSIAGFRARQGQVVGLRVTLRGRKMVDFFERLIRIVVPRVRDFSGIPIRAIDEGGSLHLGFREQFAFPEINPEKSSFVFSLGVNIVPRIKEREKVIEGYRALGIPLKMQDRAASSAVKRKRA
ncbi:50S ribosomal protein L5 [Candidatus Parcubacteria bacterium]|nr:MAG: 50S ribosomal protein L5 [Candidatus Parcubacteria bacterium]